jgi:uncharacterized protein (TIGR03085 family)
MGQDQAMSASVHARRERAELADLLSALGPDAPTLCEGWTTRDLAAHLVVRESRPDAAIGLVLPPVAGHTRRVTEDRARSDYRDIVTAVRTGPPTLSPFRLPGAEGAANLVEYVVHHEDVRRAQPGWTARSVPPDIADALWSRLRLTAKGRFRGSPVGVRLVRSDTGASSTARASSPSVVVTGDVMDLLMLAFGRREVRVDLTGDPGAAAEFRRRYLDARTG